MFQLSKMTIVNFAVLVFIVGSCRSQGKFTHFMHIHIKHITLIRCTVECVDFCDQTVVSGKLKPSSKVKHYA